MKISPAYRWLIWTAALIFIIVLGSLVPYRLDLTSENRYTVGKATRALLSNLNNRVQVTVLLEGDRLPAGFRKLAASTRYFLNDCSRISNGKLSYRFVTPEAFLEDSVQFPLDDSFKVTWLKNSAVKQNEVTQNGTLAVFNYPVALVQNEEAYTTVNLLEGQGSKGFLNPDASGFQLETINNAEAQLEYHFAAAIQALSQPRPPVLAYTVGNGQPTGPETYDLSRTLQNKYRFFLLDLQKQPFISDSIDVLMLVKPTQPFSDTDKFKLDQFLMRGGKMLLLSDALHADMDSLVRTGRDFTAYARNLGLEDLLFRYGVRMNQNLVQDRQCDMLPQAVGMIGNQPQMELMPWPYFPLLYSQSNHPVAKNLDAVVMEFPNSIDTVKAEGIQKHILLTTGNTSRVIASPVIVTVDILRQLENASAYRESGIPLAVLLEGKFRSLFSNRLTAGFTDSLQAAGRPFLAEGIKPGQILVTGDGDWVLNGWKRDGPQAMGTNPYTGYVFANKNFLLNTIDYMTDTTGIMTARSKEFTLRALDPKRLEQEKSSWQMINIGGPLLVIVLAAIVFHQVRTRRYRRPIKL